MMGMDFTVKRSCPQGGFGGRFSAPQPVVRSSSVLESLLDQVGAIPTGFPDGGQAVFSVARPTFGGEPVPTLSFGAVMGAVLGIAN